MSLRPNVGASMLRAQLAFPGIVVIPGVFDGLTAMIVERQGFDAVYVSGGAVSCRYGLPDYGLTTMSETATSAAEIASAVSVPIVVDADTGYGGELNVVRTVRELERIGVAAIQIEDQTFPKSCGHLDVKDVTTPDAFVNKIRAAADARQDEATIIIARTDARAIFGLDDAVERVNLALSAGADVAFIEAPESFEEIREIPRLVEGPCLFSLGWKGKSPDVDIATLEEVGYKIAILPGLLLLSIVGACEESLEHVRATGRHPIPPKDLSVKEVFERVDSASWDELRLRYDAADEDGASAGAGLPDQRYAGDAPRVQVKGDEG